MKNLSELGIIPVVEISDSNKAVKLAEALLKGGIKAIEITFRTKDALESIEKIANAKLDILLGAGTVLTKEQADQAIKAGADFLVSPGFNEDVVDYCLEKKYIIFPGVNNPSDIEKAIEKGLTTLKFFPAEASGGVKMLDSFAGPYKQIMFMPTGGINERNIQDYLKCKNVICCGGSWMIDKEKVINDNFKGIIEDTQRAICASLGLKIVGYQKDKLLIECIDKDRLPKEIINNVVIKE